MFIRVKQYTLTHSATGQHLTFMTRPKGLLELEGIPVTNGLY